ncbi:MAG: hypothetical protein K2K21_14515 [Lachnospiraceae bacterium]|nr:hypothetical protein [Lachnospiraceae bacterium]
MRNKKRIIFTIVMFLLICLCPCAAMAKEAPREKKAFTILVYMIGSNLESKYSEASNDIMEMKSAMSKEQGSIGDRVNLVIEYGGSNEWSLPELADSASGHGRFEISGNGIENLTRLTKANMGNAKTLADFISYGITYYPAEKFILIFWNHGNGAIEGFGYDECYSGDGLKLSELKEAFEISGMKNHDFALVGFDACLMGGIETACMMPENIEYMTASAAPEPLDGWDYGWITILGHADVTGEIISRYIADRYYAYYMEKEEKAPLTMAAFNLAEVRQFEEEFGAAVIRQMQSEGADEYFSRITESRNEYYSYDAAGNISRRAELIDVQYLIKELNTLSEEERMRLSNLLCDAAKVWEANIPEQAKGVSVYVPDKRNVFLAKDCELYENMEFMEPYKNMVSEYYRYLITRTTGRLTSVDMISYIPIGQSGLSIILSDETDVELSDIPDMQSGIGTETYMDRGQDYLFIEETPIYYQSIYKDEEYEELSCAVLYQDAPLLLMIRVYNESGMGELIAAFPLYADERTGKGIEDLNAGETIIPLYPMICVYPENMDVYSEQSIDENLPDVISIDGNRYYMGEAIIIGEDGTLNIIKTKGTLDNVGTGLRLMDDRQNIGYM